MEAHILSRIDGSVLYLTFNNVTKANSISTDMLQTLQSAMASAYHNDQITAVVLTGNGKFFCTGMNFSAGGGAIEKLSPELHKRRFNQAASLFETISNCPKVTIALVNGPCYGGGNGIVFACDIRIVVRPARFVLSEVRRGLSPATISRYIVREWGTAFAREAMITGRTVLPEELAAIRAVHYLVQDIQEGMERLGTVLGGLQACAPRAISQSKRLINVIYEENSRDSGQVIQDVFMDMTRPSEEAAFGISQFRKGVRAVDWMSWYKAKQDSKL